MPYLQLAYCKVYENKGNQLPFTSCPVFFNPYLSQVVCNPDPFMRALFLNHFFTRCPFHNQSPDNKINGKMTHLIANTALGISFTGPYIRPIIGMLAIK
jgi:hypothetical protein